MCCVYQLPLHANDCSSIPASLWVHKLLVECCVVNMWGVYVFVMPCCATQGIVTVRSLLNGKCWTLEKPARDHIELVKPLSRVSWKLWHFPPNFYVCDQRDCQVWSRAWPIWSPLTSHRHTFHWLNVVPVANISCVLMIYWVRDLYSRFISLPSCILWTPIKSLAKSLSTIIGQCSWDWSNIPFLTLEIHTSLHCFI